MRGYKGQFHLPEMQEHDGFKILCSECREVIEDRRNMKRMPTIMGEYFFCSINCLMKWYLNKYHFMEYQHTWVCKFIRRKRRR